MNKRFCLTVLIAGLIPFTPLHADIIRLGDAGLKGKVVTLKNAPPRGMRKAAIIKKYGAPTGRTSAVGNPPISSWIYPNYRIYFEHDHVIHSVAE